MMDQECDVEEVGEMMLEIRENALRFVDEMSNLEERLEKESKQIRKLMMRKQGLEGVISVKLIEMADEHFNQESPRIQWEMVYYYRSMEEVRMQLKLCEMNVTRLHDTIARIKGEGQHEDEQPAEE